MVVTAILATVALLTSMPIAFAYEDAEKYVSMYSRCKGAYWDSNSKKSGEIYAKLWG